MKQPSEYVKVRRSALEEILRDARKIEKQDRYEGEGMTSGEQYARALGSCNGLAANIRILAEMFLEGA